MRTPASPPGKADKPKPEKIDKPKKIRSPMLQDIRDRYEVVFGHEPDAEFSDVTLMLYASYYDGDEPEDVVNMTIKTCEDRLAKRSAGTPWHDDPIGLAG